ncbi:ALQxL family class IV lanthipeptide [Kitasatospora sp. NPDC058397]
MTVDVDALQALDGEEEAVGLRPCQNTCSWTCTYTGQ